MNVERSERNASSRLLYDLIVGMIKLYALVHTLSHY
jgi:hypothetical protein